MTTTTDLGGVTQLAGEDRRAARILVTAEAQRLAAQQEIAAADAAAERELRAAERRQTLDAQRRAMTRTERGENTAQRRTERAARRTERRARAVARRAWVAARVDYVRHNAPAVYSTGIYLMAVGGAVYGQVTAATGRGWPLIVGVAIASAIEGLALSMALTAHQLRLAGERALAPRALTWVCAGAAGGINYVGHRGTDQAGAVLLAALSVAGITVWEIRSSAKHRAALRALGLLPDPPARFGWRRWLRFPLATFGAWSRDVRERVGDQAAALFAAALADRQRDELRRAAAAAARAAAKGGDSSAAVEALRAMAAAGTVPASVPADDHARPGGPSALPSPYPSGRTTRPGGHPSGGTVRPDGLPARMDGHPDIRTDGYPDGWTPGPTDARARVQGMGGGPSWAEPGTDRGTVPTFAPMPSPSAAHVPAAPVPAPVRGPSPVPSPSAGQVPSAGAGRTAAARAARRTADRPAPDVADLIVPGRAVRDRLAAAGRALTRDGLVAGLRQDGHTVSSARAVALLAALNGEGAA